MKLNVALAISVFMMSTNAFAYPIRCSGTDEAGQEVTLSSDGGARRPPGDLPKNYIDLTGANYELRLNIEKVQGEVISGNVVHVKPEGVRVAGPHSFKLRWNKMSRTNPNANLTTTVTIVSSKKKTYAKSKYKLFCSIPM